MFPSPQGLQSTNKAWPSFLQDLNMASAEKKTQKGGWRAARTDVLDKWADIISTCEII